MKPNNFGIGIFIIALSAFVLSLSNAIVSDALIEAVETVNLAVANIASRPQEGNQSVVVLSQLLNLITNSGLSPEHIRFLFNFLHAHLENLPTEAELNQLIEALRTVEELSRDTSSGVSGMGDYLRRFDGGGDGGPGPGLSRGI